MQTARIRPLPKAVTSRINKRIHLNENHPIGITNALLTNFFQSKKLAVFQVPVSPIVTVAQAFDELLIAEDHPSRSASDTFYLSDNQVLRPQATCYQKEALRSIRRENSSCGQVWTCDVYRRDEVDRTHFPVFHQMDGVKIFSKDVVDETRAIKDLENLLEEAMEHVHAAAERPLKAGSMRWIHDVTFPFTHPSMELEIDGIEMLGCGLVREGLLEIGERGWAFGMGLERLAMRLFNIDDIRIFWSDDERVARQFKKGRVKEYEPVNSVRYPSVVRDLSFWIGEPRIQVNEFFEIARDVMEEFGTLESVELVDEYVSGEGRKSLCFRLTYRALDRTLTNQEVNRWHEILTERVANELRVFIR